MGSRGLAGRALIAEVAGEVLRARRDGVTRVAIDGVDGAGKTTFADRLAEALLPSGRQLIRASVDDFHHPREVRYARGRDSPEGFFLDSYDYAELRRALLDPLGPGGWRRFRRRAFDHRADRAVHAPVEEARDGAILVLDGIFLHRDGLAQTWDYSVWLDAPPAVAAARRAARGDDSPTHPRYVRGQEIYLAACDPAGRATRVVELG